MTATDDRIYPLDLVRGVAIVGMVIMNVAATGLPGVTFMLPGQGLSGIGDTVLWLLSFILIDGKMRALFAMLFGASALLVIDRAEMDGRDGIADQRRRLFALLVLGMLHYALIWSGDILTYLAVGGLVTLRLVAREPIELVKWAFALFAIQLVLFIVLTAAPFWSQTPAGHDALIERAMVHDIAFSRIQDYGALVSARLATVPVDIYWQTLFTLFETMGFMLLGMAMAKGGFFTGQWEVANYARTARHALFVGLLPTAGIAAGILLARDLRLAELLYFAAAFPFRIPITIGIAALLLMLARGNEGRALADRFAGIGRLSLSSYLLASLIATSLFYGYGGNLFARLDRAELLLVALAIIALLLVAAPFWLSRLGTGPAERAWRALRSVGARHA